MSRRRNPTRLAIIAMMTAAIIVAVLGIVHIHNRHRVVQRGYDLTRTNNKLRRLQEDNRRLRLEKSLLTNPARIRRLARERGMRPPSTGQVRIVRIPPELAIVTEDHGTTSR